MKLKILAIGIILMMLSSTLFSTAELNNSHFGTTKTEEVKEIRIAIYSMGDIFLSGIQKYFDIFDGYEWRVGNTIYKFSLTTIDDKGILKGELNTKNFDVFTMGYWEASEIMVKLSHHSIKNIIWKNRVTDFVEEGGGYFGSCAASIIVGSGLNKKPETLYEKLWDKASLDISQVKSFLQADFIIFPQLKGHPENIGPAGYFWFSGFDLNNESASIGGCCLDVVVDKENPIFDDLCEDTWRVYWCSGPAYEKPEQSNNVKFIAWYPNSEISANNSTQIHAWKYTGRLLGFLKGFIESAKMGGTLYDKLYFTPFKATDWEMTDKIIQTHLANKTIMAMETYPNDNQGRIILCGGHPEDGVWWGGHIEEANDISENNLFDSLHHWTNITKIDYKYNWCIYRREAAWAGKIPDDDFPPIYGPSEVRDFDSYNQSSEFTILGNAEEADGKVSLDLYYRYSSDNGGDEPWTNWTFYQTDNDISDGWSWKFNAFNASGLGYYQFYSLRHVQYENEWLNETAPLGPDAIAYVYLD